MLWSSLFQIAPYQENILTGNYEDSEGDEDSFDSDFSDEESDEIESANNSNLAKERDWNVEFQEIMDQDPSPSKYLALATLAHDVRVSPIKSIV